ncbi:EF-P lysine aminoacylase EpmA [Lujinxingia litoralis]|uniref:EF-P lysine aminoacylase EpmA n=1 Tax=Lujinxingia litoralis TaxID=2211119 RepID=UPI001314253D|nr:EF-P lysine aminoacylase EpmA [Lujinxingia litoralis]
MQQKDTWRLRNLHCEYEVDFATGSHLTGSHLTGSHLTGSHLTGSRLTGSHLTGSPPTDDDNHALVELCGLREGNQIRVTSWKVITRPTIASTRLSRQRTTSLGRALNARATFNQRARHFFFTHDFLEVETPAWVRAPGTDVHLSPLAAPLHLEGPHRSSPGFLHTSPELSMKRLLCEGAERIYQLTHVWRDGEVTPRHNPEFSLLEWYRAWEPLDAIIADVEALVRQTLDEHSARPITSPIHRITMQELVDQACGFDILEHLDFESLRTVVHRLNLLPPHLTAVRQWDELFFALVVEHIDPLLETLGAVFVTDWPAPLAVLARRSETDPRTAQRFELYVDGVELANGFGELTDPVEQRRRFAEDQAARRARGLPALPMPDAFLEALEYGMPPSSGVALGVDRLLMLKLGTRSIRDVAPFSLWRNSAGELVDWP